MDRVKCRDVATDRENEIREAKHAYHTALEPSIHSAASSYGISYGSLRDQLRGVQPRSAAHENEQMLTMEEEKHQEI